jgi:two-component system, NarL family, invasion response regulator UvrY
LIRILLVADHKIVRAGLRKLLADIEDCEVVGEANSGEQALEFAAKNPVDIVFMDIAMPGIGGLEATRRLSKTNPEIKVIVLSACAQDPYPYHLTQAGAKGYLTKECQFDEMMKAIYTVNSGEIYFESKIAEQLARKSIDDPTRFSPFSSLSNREMQVVLMLLKPYSLVKIAEKLHLSAKTVSTYRYRLLQKLRIKTNVELMQLAARYNVLDKQIIV